jgi:hypothetical protein
MKRLLLIEGAICLALLMFLLTVLAWHIPRWLPMVDDVFIRLQDAAHSLSPAMASLKEAADTSNMVSTETLNLVGSSVKLVKTVQRQVEAVDVGQVNAVVAEVGQVVTAATDTLRSTQTQVTDLGMQTVATIKNVDLRLMSASAQLDLTLASMPPLLAAGAQTLQASTALLDGPVATSVKDLDGVLVPSGLIVHNAQQKFHAWLYPPTQSWWARAYRFLRGVAGFSQPMYYGLKLVHENN